MMVGLNLKSLFFTGCTTLLLFIIGTVHIEAQKADRQIININPSYNQALGDDAEKKLYQIKSCKKLWVDLKDFDLNKAGLENDGLIPDMIQLICKDGTFLFPIKNKSIVKLKASKAISTNSNKKFVRLDRGETPIIGLGKLKNKKQLKSMMIIWVGIIEVN